MGEPIKVALFGASGRSGQAFARAGAAQRLVIRASVRKTAGAALPPTVEILRGDLGDADHVRDMIAGDVANRTLPVRLMARMFRWRRPAVAADRVRQEKLVRESGLEWTLVKPSRLTDGRARGRVAAAVDLPIGLLSKVSRADLASFLVGECVAPRYLKQAVYVTG